MIQPETIAGKLAGFRRRRERKNSFAYVDENGVAHIPVTRGREALVDQCDLEKAKEFSWFLVPASTGIYAKAYVPINLREMYKTSMIALHRLILELPPEVDVDHKDRNGLNCTRGNIRPATRSQNGANRVWPKGEKSPYRGVSPIGNKWRAAIQWRRKLIYLGIFGTPEEAAHAYNEAAKIYHGEFAVLNDFEGYEDGK